MAKKKQKKGDADKAKGGRAKASGKASGKASTKASGGAKLPKRVAGVKVPKQLREPGGKLLDAIRHPLVMDVAAAALMAAATALRDGKVRAALGQSGTGAAPGKPADLGTLLAATAAEGIRKIAEATLAPKGSGGQDTGGNVGANTNGGGGGNAGQAPKDPPREPAT